jgi:PIN domain nuclease of toxin-antitoxin system
MRVLLDTHVFLWWNDGNSQLSKKAHRILSDPANTLVLSVASAWEIAIKVQSGKLRIPEDSATYIYRHGSPTMASKFSRFILPMRSRCSRCRCGIEIRSIEF